MQWTSPPTPQPETFLSLTTKRISEDCWEMRRSVLADLHSTVEEEAEGTKRTETMNNSKADPVEVFEEERRRLNLRISERCGVERSVR